MSSTGIGGGNPNPVYEENRRLRAEIARLRAALEWYAELIAVAVQSTDETECLSAIGSLSRDAGARARRALDGKEADGE